MFKGGKYMATGYWRRPGKPDDTRTVNSLVLVILPYHMVISYAT